MPRSVRTVSSRETGPQRAMSRENGRPSLISQNTRLASSGTRIPSSEQVESMVADWPGSALVGYGNLRADDVGGDEALDIRGMILEQGM